MPGKASYQMYAWPAMAEATCRFWARIRAAYGSGDAELTQYPDVASAWSDRDLLLSQTCGLPFRHSQQGKVRLVGTLDYGVPGCPPGYYKSCLVVRRDDPRRDLRAYLSTPFARNSVMSQSGWGAIETHLSETKAGFSFRDVILETGGHAASARAVAEGRAGIASLDAVTWRFLKRYEPAARQLRVLTSTRPTPGLPLITGLGVDPAPLFGAVAAAIGQLSQSDRKTLGIRGLVRIAQDDYLAEPLPFPLTLDVVQSTAK